MVQRRFQDIKAYIVNVTELIWNYITYRDSFPKGVKLAVLPGINETVIDMPYNCNGCEFYDLNMFIMKDSSGFSKPSMKAIRRMAQRYFGTE